MRNVKTKVDLFVTKYCVQSSEVETMKCRTRSAYEWTLKSLAQYKGTHFSSKVPLFLKSCFLHDTDSLKPKALWDPQEK